MYNEVIHPLFSSITEPRTDKDRYDNVISKENYIGLRVQEIIDGAKEKLGFTISSKEIHYKYLIPMSELNLINWARSVLKGNEKIYYPADPDSPKVHSLFSGEDLRLTVTDKTYYPSKETIEKSYGFRSKLLLEHDGKNIFDLYRLEDHEGNEITVSELVDRYLSNPELCFKEAWSELESSDLRFPPQSQSHNLSYSKQIIINHLHNA